MSISLSHPQLADDSEHIDHYTHHKNSVIKKSDQLFPILYMTVSRLILYFSAVVVGTLVKTRSRMKIFSNFFLQKIYLISFILISKFWEDHQFEAELRWTLFPARFKKKNWCPGMFWMMMIDVITFWLLYAVAFCYQIYKKGS